MVLKFPFFNQAHDQKSCPTRDPFDKDKREAQLLEFQRLNKPGQYRDYNDKRQQNPSAPVYANTYGEGSSGSSYQPRGGKSVFESGSGSSGGSGGGGKSLFEK